MPRRLGITPAYRHSCPCELEHGYGIQFAYFCIALIGASAGIPGVSMVASVGGHRLLAVFAALELGMGC
tara:strand:+ start:4275 stop:4481 length:207 start_codon:yes stop_codon:yes gene_type:complete